MPECAKVHIKKSWPVTFYLYIKDLPETVMHSSTALFANDTKFYCKVLTANDCEKIQKDVDCVYEWSLK